MSRKEQIQEMLAEDPKDTFLRYALAMEFKSEGSSDASLEIFSELMQNDPPYVPAFFMAGQELAGLSRIDEAQKTLEEGIAHAKTQGELHAAGEMTEFLNSLA